MNAFASAAALLSFYWLVNASVSAAEAGTIELGSRPMELVAQLRPGALKNSLESCAAQNKIYQRTDFSIGHRGAPLHFPEHTRESYIAAANQGAGIVECDVTFTKDRQLVCRHDQCNLHAKTNITETELAQKCSVAPRFGPLGVVTNASSVQCCTSDITLKEFLSLRGTMKGAGNTSRGTLMSHAQSIELFRQLGVGMSPELKLPEVAMPYEGTYTQENFAQQMINEYVAAGVDPGRVWPQSFNYPDVLYWMRNTPAFGQQAVFLDDRDGIDFNDAEAVAALEPSMEQLVRDGLRFLAPSLSMLLTLNSAGEIVPSAYAQAAKAARLNMIGWTVERSGELKPGGGGFYYSTIKDAIENNGDILRVIDVLAQQVGVVGLFSDWPATTTFYANCSSTATYQKHQR